MQAQHITFGKQFVEATLADAFGQLLRRLGSIGTNLHAESQGQTSRRHSGMTQSDQPHLLACQFDERRIPIAEVGMIGPTTRAVVVGIMTHPLRNVQQMRKDHLRHRSGTVGRDVCHHDAPCVGRRNIHHVIARSQHADVAHIGQSRQVIGRQDRLVGKQDLRTGGTIQQFSRRSAVVHSEFAQSLQGLPRQIAGIQAIAIQNYYFHTYLGLSI
ncbi:hypothetical protein EVA_02556 [gut metagenome]|uniref:Uncharacterized protein n=1 Tax=gut metagenome TaxID=749906 RepID=J9H0W1_9ZZZZ